MTTIASPIPILFLAFANDRDNRGGIYATWRQRRMRQLLGS